MRNMTRIPSVGLARRLGDLCGGYVHPASIHVVDVGGILMTPIQENKKT